MVENSNTKPFNPSGNQMYLVDLREQVKGADSLDGVLNATEPVWVSIYDRMDPEEILWVLSPNEYRDGRMWPCAMAVGDHVRRTAGFKLKNIISVHTWMESTEKPDFQPSYFEILFFVKDKREYQFHKDRIRVSHIYEGNEWGGERESGSSSYHDTEVRRYNPEGKDPGNVWIKEDRTQTGDQSIDEANCLSPSEAIRRCILVGSGSKETVHILWCDEFKETIEDEGRIVNDIAEEVVE